MSVPKYRGNFGPLLRGAERKHAEVVRRRGSGWEAVEVSGRQAEGPEDVRKLVEDQEGVGRGQEGPEEVRKAVGEGGRSGRTWESNGTLHSATLLQQTRNITARILIGGRKI